MFSKLLYQYCIVLYLFISSCQPMKTCWVLQSGAPWIATLVSKSALEGLEMDCVTWAQGYPMISDESLKRDQTDHLRRNRLVWSSDMFLLFLASYPDSIYCHIYNYIYIDIIYIYIIILNYIYTVHFIFPHPYPHSTRFMPLVNLSHSARFTPGNGCTLRCPRALFAGHGSRAL